MMQTKFYAPNQEEPMFITDIPPPRVGETVVSGTTTWKVTGVIADIDGWRAFVAPVSK